MMKLEYSEKVVIKMLMIHTLCDGSQMKSFLGYCNDSSLSRMKMKI